MRIQELNKAEMAILFRKQLSLLMEKFVKEVYDHDQVEATEIAIRFLRTDKYNKKDEKEKRVVKTMLRNYILTIDETILIYASLN